ncbi:MAG TPA: hypothetical protein VN285_04890, partial [Candidatus Deferrimicrobium sp.]|nr:hypothetical protein [Candidatus Deferrimicrobium sp.]
MVGLKRFAQLFAATIAVLLAGSCGDDESTSPTVSQPGDVWTLRPTGTSSYLFDVAFSGSQYVIVGEKGVILTSLDGITWTTQPPVTANDLFGVHWSETQFVAVGDKGTILLSPDGVAWDKVDSAGTSVWLYGVASSGERL